MSEQDTLPRAKKKFFFDSHHFDEPEDDVIEEDIPPPPTFSEEELADARKESYERGKNDGLREAHTSFEKQTEALLEVIARDTQTLFKAEQERSQRYEIEAVALADAIFKRLFPALDKVHGLAEIKAVIDKILAEQKDVTEIIIAVHPDYKNIIEKHIEKTPGFRLTATKISVAGDDNLGAGDCRLSWADGGGLRDISKLSEQIGIEIEQLLADYSTNKDNKDNIIDSPDVEVPAQTQADNPEDNGDSQ